MFPEISLHILDVAENAVRAEATEIRIGVEADTKADRLTVTVSDNGCGMTEEEVRQVTDPFYTTRETRRVGLGIPFFKQAAEMSGGTFAIRSEQGRGTEVEAVFGLSHVDRMPLGDLPATMHTLITMQDKIDFLYCFRVNDRSFHLDTREMREILGDISFREAEVSDYLRLYLQDNTNEVTGDHIL